MKNRITALIPARGGSKGLPKKNIIDLSGKPLIAWSIEASIGSKYIDRTIVSSENEEILRISQLYGASILSRPDELSQDETSTTDVIIHAINSLKGTEYETDIIVLLQPTSPLRSYFHIDRAFDVFFQSNATALVSVCEIDNKILKAFKMSKDGYLSPISDEKFVFSRRQELPDTFISNGAIYIVKVNEFMKKNSLLTDKTIMFKMDKKTSIDIDTADDLIAACNIIKEAGS
jgi:CMP-N,N'-diacetyllegionaminic acid synthase